MCAALSAAIMKTVNNRAFGRKGYERWRRCANGRRATVQTAASAVLSQTAPVPKGKVRVVPFLFFFFFYKELQLRVSHIRAHQHWSCDTPGGNWQLSTLVNACHLLLSISSPCPTSVLVLARINLTSLSLCVTSGVLTLKRLQLGRCDVSAAKSAVV